MVRYDSIWHYRTNRTDWDGYPSDGIDKLCDSATLKMQFDECLVRGSGLLFLNN